MTVLVTGVAGFIGYHTAAALIERGERVVGVDNLNSYYSPKLKAARLDLLKNTPRFHFINADITDRAEMASLAAAHPAVKTIVHLAAQAGVRYSLKAPYSYVNANVMGQLVMLETARLFPHLANFVYASSSSVYGGNEQAPFKTTDRVDHPVSLYAATKRSAELISESYHHLYQIPMVGLRFFTVYGPWGRPDMAYYKFTKAIFENQPITVYNEGRMQRDFTWIGDIIGGVLGAIDNPAPGHRLYNLGNHRPENLLDFISVIESALGKTAQMKFAPMQPGDVPSTYADIEASQRDLGFNPTTPIIDGIPQFVDWFTSTYDALEGSLPPAKRANP